MFVNIEINLPLPPPLSLSLSLSLLKVVEVVNSDAIVVKTDKGQYQKVFFSSFRPPRKTEDSTEQQQVKGMSKIFIKSNEYSVHDLLLVHVI